MGLRVRSGLLKLTILMPCLCGVAGSGQLLVIPYRIRPITIDGQLRDWQGGGAVLELADPGPGPDPNHARVTLSWDRDNLYAAFEVADGLVLPPDKGLGPAELYQGDSVELYVDGGAERSPRMDGNDFQFIVSCDGRTATLQGEPVLGRFKHLSVPKIERTTPAVTGAARRVPTGFVVELSVSLAAVVTSAPGNGTPITVDLAVNDWDTPHPPIEGATIDDVIDSAREILRGNDTGGGEEDDPSQLARLVGYRPWSLCSERDFGYPAKWRRAVLQGEPPWIEQVASRLGPGRLVLVVIGLSALVWVLLLAAVELRHRRRIRTLVERLAELDRPEPQDHRPGSEPLHVRVALADESSRPLDPVVARAVAAVRERIDRTLSPGELAAEIHVSLRTLQRSLHRHLGCSPRELILGAKMCTARRLMETGAVRVGEAAARVGFSDPAYFSRRYRAYFGHPPSEDMGS